MTSRKRSEKLTDQRHFGLIVLGSPDIVRYKAWHVPAFPVNHEIRFALFRFFGNRVEQRAVQYAHQIEAEAVDIEDVKSAAWPHRSGSAGSFPDGNRYRFPQYDPLE